MMFKHYIREIIMKKSVLTGILLSSTLLMGSEYGMFAGIEGSSDRINPDSGAKSAFEYGIGIRGGFVADNHRIYGVYNYNDDLDMHTLVVAGDAMTEPYVLADWLAGSFFIGAHAGIHDVGTLPTRPAYGVQGGMMLHFTPQVNLELGARYTASGSPAIEDIEGGYVGLNVNF